MSVSQMIMARSQVQHTKYTVLLSVLMYFLLLRAFSFFFSFFLQPTTPRCLVLASRHHSSAFSDCLHADGCRDYARHFRFCTTDRSVFVFFDCVCNCMSVWVILEGDNPVYSQQISSKVSHVFQVSISPVPW